MLLRNRVLDHPLGSLVDLPLLIPAFSSKGFPFFTAGLGRKKKTYSSVTYALEQLSGYIKESMLLSAYDLHHGFYRTPQKHLKDIALVFVDSGGYELNPEFDSTEPKITPYQALSFTPKDYRQQLNRLGKALGKVPFVIANYDWETRSKPFEEQISLAQKFFNRFPNWLSDFILKPHSKRSSVINIDELIPHVAKLKAFSIVGVTEKELGKNLLSRLKGIANLRAEMNRRGVSAPIHVWGGLDPLITPVYYFAGADIFDGVSWLRYTYHKGLAVNRQCFGVLEKSLGLPQDHALGLSMNRNLMTLQDLATSLRAFSDSGGKRFDVFEHNRDILKKAFLVMTTRINELKGDR